MPPHRTGEISRRSFVAGGFVSLAVGTVGLALAGCSATGDASRRASSPSPTSALTPDRNASYTIDELLATTPFYIAHRGSRDNWAEHTMDAYAHAVDAGAKAIEVSVNATKDGVLVCHHDTNMTQTSDSDVVIASVDWAELSRLSIDERQWLGPAAGVQPIPLLTDVLGRYARTHVIFIEDKQGTNTAALLDLMDGYPESTSHFVWKQPAMAAQYAAVQARGYRTWGYFTPELMPRLDELAERFDYLGAMHTAPDDDIARIVAVGKPVIVWEVHYRSMLKRLRALGVAGIMCSNLPYVTRSDAAARRDAFGSGMRAAGDLPWTVDQGTAIQPTIDQQAKSLRISYAGVQSYLMGSMAPISGTEYTISARFRWPESLPAPSEHGGIAFGQSDDSPYRVGVPSSTAGYHAIVRADGSLQLYRRAAGVAAGTQLKSVATDAPRPGEWVALKVHVGPDTIEVSRTGADTWRLQATDTAYRGGYFWLCKNYASTVPIEFEHVQLD